MILKCFTVIYAIIVIKDIKKIFLNVIFAKNVFKNKGITNLNASVVNNLYVGPKIFFNVIIAKSNIA